MPIDHVHALPPGTRFEEYRLDAVLGAGGFGITYRAYDANLEKFVAIKEYLPGEFAARTAASTVVPHSSTDAQDYQWGLNRFLDEARTLARFDHPHLNKVYRFFEAKGTAYMVLEYIEGETLAGRLQREARLPEDVLQRMLEEVLSGLEVVHDAGYVHRDIKPGNLMLRAEDGGAVLLDFGAARQAVGRRSQRLTTILTPGYAPIEQYDSKAEDVGPWSDVYALGMVAYRCISGAGDAELPDAVTRAREQRKGDEDLAPTVEVGKGQYSAKLLAAIDWAIEVDEEARPQGVGAWRQALTGGGVRKGKTRAAGKPAKKVARPPAAKHAGMSWSGIALTLVIIALLGASAWQGWRLYREMPDAGMDTAGVPADSQADAPAAPQTGVTPDGQTEAAAPDAGPDSAAGEDTGAVNLAESAPPPAEAVPDTTPPVKEDEVARLLAAAEADIEARRLTSPVGNNAWEKYQRVLGLSPAHPEAVAGIERVIGSYMELFGVAVEQEDFDKAVGYLAKVRELHPDAPALEDGARRIETARQAQAERLAELERQAEEAARQAELAEQEQQRQAEADRNEASFERALRDGDTDKASTLLLRMRRLHPDSPKLSDAQRRLDKARQVAHQVEQERRRQTQAAVGQMISIPGGNFRMGDLSGEGWDAEKPVHNVRVPAFKLGKYEVTVGQFRRFVTASGYRTDAERNTGGNQGCVTYIGGDEFDLTAGRSWRSPGYALQDDQPVACVSWNDAQAFIDWLNDETDGNYRLPSEAEWEYAARARSTTKYHFGNDESQLCRYANHRDRSVKLVYRNESCSDGVGERTAEVGRYQPNRYGLYDMHGNLSEWVQDCWNNSYAGAPTDGSAWTSGDCSLRVRRGGSWHLNAWFLRSASRYVFSRTYRADHLGFRLAQDR